MTQMATDSELSTSEKGDQWDQGRILHCGEGLRALRAALSENLRHLRIIVFVVVDRDSSVAALGSGGLKLDRDGYASVLLRPLCLFAAISLPCPAMARLISGTPTGMLCCTHDGSGGPVL